MSSGYIPRMIGQGIEMFSKLLPCESLVKKYLENLTVGKIVLVEDGKETIYGDKNEKIFKTKITINNKQFFTRIALKESVGLGESYMDGDWECDDLVSFFCIMVENMKLGKKYNESRLVSFVSESVTLGMRWLMTNSPSTSAQNVYEHYDLGNDFYQLWLDKDAMAYTCALYLTPQDSLETAQLNKIKLVVEKAQIKSTDVVLELGCGWGGFAIWASKLTGCKVVAYNLSKEQIAHAKKWRDAEGLKNKIFFQEDDYRNAKPHLNGTPTTSATGELYDKIVSIGMLEHVGHYDLPTFFKTCDNLLKPNGILVTHCITYIDSRYEEYRKQTDFTKIYIFPGSDIPSVNALISAATPSTFVAQHLENLSFNYALTCREWRKRFNETKDKLNQKQYDIRFQRMWDFYLAWAEAAFVSKNLGLTQIIFKRPGKDAGWPVQTNFVKLHAHGDTVEVSKWK